MPTVGGVRSQEGMGESDVAPSASFVACADGSMVNSEFG